MHERGLVPRVEARTNKFTMLMTDDERAKLDELAEADRRTASDWMRVAVETAHEQRFGATTISGMAARCQDCGTECKSCAKKAKKPPKPKSLPGDMEAHWEAVKRLLESESDRGAVLVAGAFIDELLSELFVAKSAPVPDQFGNKISVAGSRQWLRDEMIADLNLLVDIRNDAAHFDVANAAANFDFDLQTYDSRLAPAALWLAPERAYEMTGRERFVLIALQIALELGEVRLGVPQPERVTMAQLFVALS